MRILLVYGDEPGTFGRYWRNALVSQNHSVITCGPKTKTGTGQDITTSAGLVDIILILKRLGPKLKPDFILQLDSPFNLYLKNLEKISIPTGFFWTDVTIKLPILRHYAKCFDYLFTCCETFVPLLQKSGLKAFALPLAIDPKVHRDHKLDRSIDVGFVGHLSTIYNPKRTYFLNYLKSKTPIEIKTDIFESEMSKFYSRCKIVFNLSVTPGVNMRSFEALAAGCLLVQNDDCTDMRRHFVRGKDYVAYGSASQATHIINYYLNHPAKAQKIARTGQKKALANHLYTQRAEKFIKIVTSTPHPTKSEKVVKINLGKTIFMSNQSDLIDGKSSFPPILAKITPKKIYPTLVATIRQIETFQFRWSIPFWYIAIAFLPVKLKLENIIWAPKRK